MTSPFNDITGNAKEGFGKTGPFDFWVRTSFGDMLHSNEDKARMEEHMQREVDFKIGRALTDHIKAVTHDGREYIIKTYHHPAQTQRDPVVYAFYTYKLFRVTGYIVLVNPDECEIGEFTRITAQHNVVYSRMYVNAPVMGRRVFNIVKIDGIAFHKCVEFLPFTVSGFEYQEPKEADVEWRDPVRKHLPSGKHTLPPGEIPLP